MRICLIRCPSPFLINERVFPPLGLMAVGTALKEQGHQVTIYDGDFENIPIDFMFYGFGPTTPEYPYAMKVKEKIKMLNPMARVILGGPYATLNRDECLYDGWDCVVCGDGGKVAQMAFSTPLSLIVADERPLDEYPIIDRSIINIWNYEYCLNGRQATTMITSQGCPYKCAFCAKNYKKVRFKSIQMVKQEIDILYFQFGFQALAFVEDMFILNRKRTEEICRHLKKLDIIWRCLVRGDFIVKYGMDFVSMMANSGCVEVGMGIESGSDEILKNVNKQETVNTIKQAIRMFKKAGIRVKGYFILGLPGETEKTIHETNTFLNETDLDDVDIKIYQPYPGTPIWDNKENYDVCWNDNVSLDKLFYKGRYGEYYGNITTSSLTNAMIVDAWKKMELKYKQGTING